MKTLAMILCFCVILSFFSFAMAGSSTKGQDTIKHITDKAKGIESTIEDTSAASDGESLIKTSDFLQSFNLYAAISNLGHTMTTDSAEISRFSDSVMLKTVFNGCEILSLDLTSDSEEVIEIHCTFSTSIPGASKYQDDFIYLLMEVLAACGMETNSIADLFTEIGVKNEFNIGDSGEAIADGIKVSYSVSTGIGLSFIIEKAHAMSMNDYVEPQTDETGLAISKTIAADYIKWLTKYGLEVKSSPYVTPEEDEKNEKMLFVDDLGMSYNNSTFEVSYVSLLLINDETKGIDIVDQWKRAASFFGAIEYGNPDTLLHNMPIVKREIHKIVQAMNDAMFEYSGFLHDGIPICFYSGNKAGFYIAYWNDDKQWLISAQ